MVVGMFREKATEYFAIRVQCLKNERCLLNPPPKKKGAIHLCVFFHVFTKRMGYKYPCPLPLRNTAPACNTITVVDDLNISLIVNFINIKLYTLILSKLIDHGPSGKGDI